jgi:putative FmdB family regulatory protein
VFKISISAQEIFMPIYDYECMGCQKEFEAIHRVDERDDVVCPQCGTKKLRQKVSIFNSSGWAAFLDKMDKKVKSAY